VKQYRLIAIAGAAALLVACSNEPPQTGASEAAPEQRVAAVNPHAGMSGHPGSGDPHAGVAGYKGAPDVHGGGKLVTRTEAGQYVYLEVETDQGTQWLAALQANVAEGDSVAWGETMVMDNFTSKALGRTFERILFVEAVVAGDAAGLALGDRGKVLEVLEGGGYSYVKVDQNGQQRWVAGPMTAVNVGDTVSWSGANTMRNFASSSLGRSFDELVLAAGLAVIAD
jgi:hypothetical protein